MAENDPYMDFYADAIIAYGERQCEDALRAERELAEIGREALTRVKQHTKWKKSETEQVVNEICQEALRRMEDESPKPI